MGRMPRSGQQLYSSNKLRLVRPLVELLGCLEPQEPVLIVVRPGPDWPAPRPSYLYHPSMGQRRPQCSGTRHMRSLQTLGSDIQTSRTMDRIRMENFNFVFDCQKKMIVKCMLLFFVNWKSYTIMNLNLFISEF